MKLKVVKYVPEYFMETGVRVSELMPGDIVECRDFIEGRFLIENGYAVEVPESMRANKTIPSNYEIMEEVAKRRYANLKKRSKRFELEVPEFKEIFELVRKAYKENDFRCHYCSIEMEIRPTIKGYFGRLFSIDHYLPLTLNGDNSLDNLVVCCTRCNLVKGAVPGDFYKKVLQILEEYSWEFKEKYLNLYYKSALASKIERNKLEREIRNRILAQMKKKMS